MSTLERLKALNAANLIGKLITLWETVLHNPCRHTADHNVCDTCEALKALESTDDK